MSMRCKQCGEAFPKGQQYTVFEMKRQQVSPVDDENSTVFVEDAGIFCSRKCLGDYLNAGNQSGVFDLGSRKL